VIVPLAAALAYVAWLILVVLSPLLVGLLLIVTFPFDRNRRVAGRWLRIMGAGIARAFPLWRIRVEGRWPRGRDTYVVVANHQSLLDVPLICNATHEMKWLTKKELFRVPFLGWGFWLAGDIPLVRGDAESGGRALAMARRYLDRGMNVMIFPEGTRSRDGSLRGFKLGAFTLAADAKRAVLPIAVNGTAQAWPKGSPWVRPARLAVRVLEPIRIGDGPDEAARLRDEARRVIAAALEELRAAAVPGG
jgi:1-acyl-sn-glycerol-3-phosphate acyltransferase